VTGAPDPISLGARILGMNQISKISAFTISAVLLAAACATRPPVPVAAAPKAFVVEQDLVGTSVARGEFRSITGVRRGFTAQLTGAWDGRALTLVEEFAFDDGERDHKTWRLERIGPGRYAGTREDVVGQARGFQDGAVFRLEYEVILPSSKGRGRTVRFRDVMAFNGNGDILNNATVGWWGLRVGSVTLTIQRAGG
jgi:hypothetical protein